VRNAAARTPRLLLDEQTLDRNIRRLADWAERLGLTLRPHLKTHKSPEIMRRQLDAGARGITVATVREAELFVDAGATDVLLAYPPVGEWRLDAVAELAGRARVLVACDAPEHVEALAALGVRTGRTFDYYWELDSGGGRLGTQPGEETAAILERLARIDGARLAGLMAFPGHSYQSTSPDARREIALAEGRALVETKEALARRGIDAGVLSGGSTPTVWEEAGKDGLDEYRCGNYVFADATQVALGTAELDDCALTVEATVVGRPARERVILDSGSKALPAERMPEGAPGFGIVLGHPELEVRALFEEHAICVAEGGSPLRVGDLVRVIPNHACTCANLHERYHVAVADGSTRVWPVAARGWDSAA
jgi:D-serine deaminase-like pyridoxal phosphate-dependent protein